MEQQLEKRPLGTRTGLAVARVGLGMWAVPGGMWGPADDDQTLDAIGAALDAGVDLFDTADIYGAGRSEQLLGRAMAGRRDSFVVATKIGLDGYDREKGRSRYDTAGAVLAGLESSLERLGTDHVEVIQCHVDHLEPHTGVYIEAFRRLKQEGMVRAWGVSTSDFALLQRFNADGDCDVLQIDYSILNRTPEREILPYCLANGIGVLARGPLAMGVLTGKFSRTDAFPDGDFRQGWIQDPARHEQFLSDLAVAEEIRRIVPDGETPAQFALRFVASHPAVTAAIPGARNRSQAASNASAARGPVLGAEEQAAVDRVVPPGGGRRIWPA